MQKKKSNELEGDLSWMTLQQSFQPPIKHTAKRAEAWFFMSMNKRICIIIQIAYDGTKYFSSINISN